METTDTIGGRVAIAVRELDPTSHLALKHNQLTSQRGILSLKSADRSERRNQQPQKEEEQRDHRGRRYVILSSHQMDEVFGTHRDWFHKEKPCRVTGLRVMVGPVGLATNPTRHVCGPTRPNWGGGIDIA